MIERFCPCFLAIYEFPMWKTNIVAIESRIQSNNDGNGRAETSGDLCGCEHGDKVLTGEGDLLYETIGTVGKASHGVDAEGDEAGVLVFGEVLVLGQLGIRGFVGSGDRCLCRDVEVGGTERVSDHYIRDDVLSWEDDLQVRAKCHSLTSALFSN